MNPLEGGGSKFKFKFKFMFMFMFMKGGLRRAGVSLPVRRPRFRFLVFGQGSRNRAGGHDGIYGMHGSDGNALESGDRAIADKPWLVASGRRA